MSIPYYLDEATRVVTVERHGWSSPLGIKSPRAYAWFVVDQHDGAIKEAPEPLKSLYEPVRSWTLDRLASAITGSAIEKRTALKLPWRVSWDVPRAPPLIIEDGVREHALPGAPRYYHLRDIGRDGRR